MVNSPCISVCEMDEDTGYCRGCYRSLNEIANWSYYHEDKKKQVIAMTQTRRYCPQKNAGFSLIELAISIAIIGFLVGGVIAARSYIESAALQKQIGQINQIQTAITQFQQKYGCYPGDCLDPTIITDSTYSGNGNGYLSSTWNDDENKGFWIHLYNSQMIPYELRDHSALAGMQTPRMVLRADGVINALGNFTTGQNVLIFATEEVKGAFTTEQIIAIDDKIDDDIAASGSVRSTGYGTGSTTIYAGSPFPLSVNNDGGSDDCITDGDYSGIDGECNMVFILAQ